MILIDWMQCSAGLLRCSRLSNVQEIRAGPLHTISALSYTPSPAEAEFDGLTAGLGTIQLCP